MRISLLTDGIFPYVTGGMQRHSFYLCKYLLENGHQVDLYHTNQSEKDIHALEVFTPEAKKNLRSFVVIFPKRGRAPGHYIRESYDYSKKIWDVFRKQTLPDFIYAKGFSSWELLNQKRKGVKLPPVGVNFHGYEMFQPAPSLFEELKYALILRHPVKFCVRHADCVFSYGGKITAIIKGLGVLENKILEIPAGIDPSWLVTAPVPHQGNVRFIFVGRYERRKGLPELYAAIRALPDTMNFEFNFIGDIPVSKRLRRDHLKYHGKITDNEKMKEHLRHADVLVCPSHSEGMPNVILEGMASGLAIIATDVGAISVAVNNKNGWLIEPRSKTQLVNALVEAGTVDLASKRAAALEDVRTKFLWPEIGAKTISLISNFMVHR
ncbi:MAG TPA: glycosyltransferase family 4 protein [Bacteroidia bacterium]|nr:glycosyltransferase family 4 protein [Bacteroidia bacterium]